ncbi:hypothetical protein T440DRAFT_513113 [Plenodomus tracheiphilus IPT5]|uniref:Uncharacterized protein n=1 Tax=Plenodomus tracheiphilus IPT5 TaxID=1408161 RepID=A0A6A7BPA9_9PLEO|nr:hypothetical protein T440DRAFT_513113 [Plenodomus tracheiphilus IPT5]
METIAEDTCHSGLSLPQEATMSELDDSHFQLPIRTLQDKLDAPIAEDKAPRRNGEALGADVSDNDSTGSWEKVEISFAEQVLLDLARQREDPPCSKTSRLPMVDYDVFYEHVLAGDLVAVKAALDIGANIERENDDGITPLVLSIIHSQIDVIRLLLEKGAEVDHLVEGLPPTVHAVENAQHAPQILKLLI